jgi:D-alanyl-D-alanine carboxypeptidase/D-alanyl-D-alanine-endopeptidase (penicillin-binding protein 4)
VRRAIPLSSRCLGGGICTGEAGAAWQGAMTITVVGGNSVAHRAAVLALLAALTLAQGTFATAEDIPASVAAAITAVTSQPIYAHSTLGIRLADLATGEVLIDRTGNAMFVPGSIMKTYSTSTALDVYGPDYRFRTPVYRVGRVSGGMLHGHLVLVAAGDFSFGLREQPDGTMAFNNVPEIDHNSADTGFPGGALIPNSNPLAALDELAAQVRAAGIRGVRDVVVDDRLFATYTKWNGGLIAPIWVNENVIDITTTPTSPGEPATVDWRPKTAAIRVVGDVTTVEGDAPPLTVDSTRPRVVRISGQISASSPPVLNISQIPDPASFARTAFIQALRRAGVRVSGNARRPNPSRLLPASTTYPPDRRVAEHVSPPLSEFIKVILKVSYNRGANLMLCLAAAAAGSTDCNAGIGRELEVITRNGASRASTIVFDGAGADERARTSPADETTFLRTILGESWGSFIRHGMAVLGVDGNQAGNGRGTPAAGHISVKDGQRAATTPGNYQGIITANTQVGYIEAKSGRQLVYAVFLNNTPFATFEDFLNANHDVASIAAAFQQGY